MKSVNVSLGCSYGFSAPNSGQRNVVVEPQVIATSTDGAFRITPIVSRALGIANGEYVMFVNNIDMLDKAIAEHDENLVALCEEAEIEFGTPEAAVFIHKELDLWGIAKGILEKDTKGNVKTCAERLSKNDKIRFVSQHLEEMLSTAMAEADEDTKAALTRDGITEAEQVEILTAFVTPRELPKYRGSKTANPAGLSGTGVTLNFTDSNFWKQLKADLGETASKVNRVYSVNVDDLQDGYVNNGYEDVPVKILLLGKYVDKEPARIGKESAE